MKTPNKLTSRRCLLAGISLMAIHSAMAQIPTITESAKLQPPELLDNDYFGGKTAISGNTLVVGARNYDDHNGAVYI